MADDLYDFLADPSDSARGRRLADALRQKKSEASALLISPQLAQMGQAQLRDVGAQEQEMQRATGGRLTRAAALEREQAALAERERVSQAGMPLKKLQVDAQIGRIEAEKERTAAMLKKSLGKVGKGAAAPALGPDGKPASRPLTVAEQKLEILKQARGAVPGWEAVDPSAGVAFADPAHQEKFKELDSSLEAMGGHAEKAKAALKRFLAAPATSLKERDIAASEANQALNFLSAKSRVAEGLNNSDQANSTAESMLGMQHGTAFDFRNLANPERVPALIDAILESSKANVDALGKHHGLRRKGAGVPTSAPTAPVKMQFPDGSTHDVAPEDVDLAKRKGGKPIG